jgi:antitoxin component YwqK of YwqJK toxin-antitoxin module
VTYFVNGQKSHEIHYEDGKRNGDFIAYYPEGPKSFVLHFNHNILEGEDTGYYPSGRINYRGVHRAGKQAGTWVWYSESGTTNTTKDYSK